MGFQREEKVEAMRPFGKWYKNEAFWWFIGLVILCLGALAAGIMALLSTTGWWVR